ncbi:MULTISPECIES: hypothetical protein [Roseobacteraceae]|nr:MULTISPECIES: hypothetical protein [Roseobacteraceae]MBT3143379.1 hypothetical protein [Falsiruegeria litorea]MBT8169797.1 hypothetical protein [Falsiruegeria litorea]
MHAHTFSFDFDSNDLADLVVALFQSQPSGHAGVSFAPVLANGGNEGNEENEGS